MKRTRHTPEQVIRKLRDAERMLAGAPNWPMSAAPWRSPCRPTTGLCKQYQGGGARRSWCSRTCRRRTLG
jgi:hypothetical protein